MKNEPAQKLSRDRRINPKLMWVIAAALLFIVGAGFYVSATRDYEGEPLASQRSPNTTDSSVAGARGLSGQPADPQLRQDPAGRGQAGQTTEQLGLSPGQTGQTGRTAQPQQTRPGGQTGTTPGQAQQTTGQSGQTESPAPPAATSGGNLGQTGPAAGSSRPEAGASGVGGQTSNQPGPNTQQQ